jgi:hypothetical protein
LHSTVLSSQSSHFANSSFSFYPIDFFSEQLFFLSSGALFLNSGAILRRYIMEYTASSLDENGSTNAKTPGKIGGVGVAAL